MAVIADVLAGLEITVNNAILKGDIVVSVPVIVVACALARNVSTGGGGRARGGDGGRARGGDGVGISSSSLSLLSFVTCLLSLAMIPPAVALSVIADVSAGLVVVIIDALFIVDMVVSAWVMASTLFTWGSEILS